MFFGELPLEQCEGAILAHSQRIPDGRLKKGRVLGSTELAALRAAGFERLVVARPGPGDVAEDTAAARLAAALCGVNVTMGAPFTGRCNLFASQEGLLVLDPAGINRINCQHEALTVATLPHAVPVSRREMLATVKIIPFVAPSAALERCEQLAWENGPLVQVRPFVRRRVGLIQTSMPGDKHALYDKTFQVLAARLAVLGARIEREVRCRHETVAVSAAIAELLADSLDLILIVGASAIVDRRDVIPAGLVAAGGRIEHYGMPMDPGNLLLLGYHETLPVLGLPGCARSPKYNGLDPVLGRLAAGFEVGAEEIMGLGVGGLLKDYVGRPQPRTESERAPARATRVTAVLLAAGQSQRMGGDNKLLLELGGQPMILRVAEAIRASRVDDIVVVTGHEATAVEQALAGLPLHVVHNPNFAEGLSASLRTGLAAVPEDRDAVLICLGDMPGVTTDHINRLLAAFDPVEGRAVCVPTCSGRRGNPVLWDRTYLPVLQRLTGDAGARHLLEQYADVVCEVELGDPGVLIDVDTPQSLTELVDGSGDDQ